MTMENQERAKISQFRRYLWHFNRLPTGKVLKAALRLLHWREVRERRALARALPADAELDVLAAALNRDGYVFISDVVDPQLLADLSKASEIKMKRLDAAAKRQSLTHKSFWTRLLDEDMTDGKLPTDNPFVRYALQPAIIGIVARALGEIPRLDYVLLTNSHSTNQPWSYSQLWHYDHDDPHVVKTFIYLTDVHDGQDGPFTFLPAQVSDRVGPSLKSHRSDEEIFTIARPEEKKEMTAPRLSAFIVDTTRCLHMGSRVAPGHSRLLYTATYIPVPRLFPEPPSPFRVVGEPDAVTRKILNIQ